MVFGPKKKEENDERKTTGESANKKSTSPYKNNKIRIIVL